MIHGDAIIWMTFGLCTNPYFIWKYSWRAVAVLHVQKVQCKKTLMTS